MNSNNKKRNGSLTPVGNVLQTLFQNSKSELSDQFLRWKLWNFWPQIVGPTLAKCSEPVGYHKGCLYVWVDHSARLQELSFMAGTLRDKVNTSVGKKNWIRSIRFTLDRKAVPQAALETSELKSALSKDFGGGNDDIDR